MLAFRTGLRLSLLLIDTQSRCMSIRTTTFSAAVILNLVITSIRSDGTLSSTFFIESSLSGSPFSSTSK
jgi:hypothetical protein